MQISLWEKESFYADKDVIIIGAGLAGLWTAFELKQKSAQTNILILEKGIIPAGASTRNAGFACFGSPTELIYDAKMLGEDKMWQIVEMRYKGIEKIRKIFDDKQIDFDECGGYECLNNELNNIEEIKDKLRWLNNGLKKITGLNETFVWANDKLKTFCFEGFDALIENKLEAGLHSGKLVQALTKKVQSLGVEILTGITVTGWKEEEKNVIVETKESLSFKAKELIVCSNAFTSSLIKDSWVKPGRGQIVVTSPIEDLKIKGTFHYDEGFYYFRNVGNRLLLGGARNKAFEEEATTELVVTNTIQNELKRFISTHLLPQKFFAVEYAWSGIMGFTENKQPLIKKLSDRITAIVVCNGMGVALTPIISEGLIHTLQL